MLMAMAVIERPETIPTIRKTARSWTGVLLVLLLIALGIGADWWYHYTGTPEYSLSRLGKAVKAKNYGEASRYVDEEKIAGDVSQSLTDVLVAKYTYLIRNDPLPFTEARIGILQSIAPRFHTIVLIGARNAIRLLLSGNGILIGSSGFKQLDVHNFSQLHVLRSEVHGDMADVVVGGMPQPNPLGLEEIRLKMQRIPHSRQWRIEQVPDAAPIFAKYFDAEEAWKKRL